ncbi:MAG: hypothetical protein K2G51_00115 [Lachnospiraceae bacterium]|nr:hypothetical protein [Lachnospiraceae bacterium]MDE7273844.1 hypothetical protein [Lachnospiraceae bacterium]
MKRLARIIAFIVCIPLIGSILIKPDKRTWEQKEDDTSAIDERFEISVREDIGTFYYKPETLTGLLMYCVIPQDTVFSISEDYIVSTDDVWDPEQEYLKALAIVCRSCIVYTWESEMCPEVLDYDNMQFAASDLYQIVQTDALNRKVLSDKSTDNRCIKLNEIKKAVDATQGAVITRDGKVMTAPFFTTTSSDLLVQEAGSGSGFSLNYAYELAVEGMNFYELLKHFYGDIRVMIYE